MPNLPSSEILRSVKHSVNEIYQATMQNCAMSAVANVVWQEPITWSEQLPYWGYVTAFSRMGLFFGTFYNNFFSAKLEAPFVYKHIRSIYYGDQNVIKV